MARRMHVASYIIKVTNIDSEYVIGLHIVFPQQQWLHERAAILRFTYTAYLVNDRYITAPFLLQRGKERELCVC